MDFEERYAKKKLFIEKNIYGFLPQIDEKCRTLYNAMKYSLEAGGKRLRPILFLSACEFCDGDEREALPYACAIEFIHTYSLIHDDLPAMDDDDYRRGKPSNHKAFGEAAAILAGDGLLNTSMEVICSDIRKTVEDSEKTKKKSAAAMEIFTASGCKGMIGGQMVDIESEGKMFSADTLDFIHLNKTSALLTASIRGGALLSGADSSTLADLTEFAQNMGLAFQITDDILDICGDEQLLGKSIGSDAKLNKLTYPALYGLEASKKKIKELEQRSYEILESYQDKSVFLKELLLHLSNRCF